MQKSQEEFIVRNRYRWLASALTISLALGNCGSITVLAAEEAFPSNITVSENNIVLEEVPDMDAASEAAEPDREAELPALHIGQIPEGEKLPSADEDAFPYDLPVSFETTESLILFVNYDIGMVPENEAQGTLEWSILRGEKGMAPGSTNLLDKEDDWNGFEEVPSSPLFTMEKIADEKNAYYQMMALTPGESSAAVDHGGDYENEEFTENYDYYIRAAYYPETENGKVEAFYAAATIPFVPINDTAADTNQASEEPTGMEGLTADSTQGDSSLSENSADAAAMEMSGDSPADTLPADENDVNDISADAHSENAGETQTAEPLSTLSENDNLTDISTFANGKASQQDPQKAGVVSLTLSETQTLTMQPKGPGSTKQITATVTVYPSDAAAPPLLWESSDETVATVSAGENTTATVTAVAEGYAKINASCGGKTASVTVDVVPDATNPADKLLDLSNEIRVAGFEKESDSLVYTGQKITQDLRVYYRETLLTEKTDYTLTYRNNINAAKWNTAKAPSVTINLKGQYQGSITLYYTIRPFPINQIDLYDTDGEKTPGYEQTVNYGKNVNIPAPALSFGRKKLAAKRDFACNYDLLTEELGGKDYKKGDSYETDRVYHYTVNGVGNYTGSFQMGLVILGDRSKDFGTASVKLDKARYDYRGMPLSKGDVKIESLKISRQILDPALYDYEVCAAGIDGAYLTVFPTESGRAAGFRGCKKINLKLAGDRKINAADFGANWKNEITFSQQTVNKTGGMFQEKTNLLKFGSDTLVEGTDYTIKYSNATKVGNVTVTFKGLGRYTGSVVKRYKITPNIDSRNLTIVWGDNVTEKEDGSLEIPYQKNGAAPEFYIRDENYAVLNSRTDYTVQLKDNRKPKTETKKDMTCTIKGKGNYKGYEKVVALTVTKADISEATITVPDKPHDPRPNRWKAAATVTDTNGKKLTAGTDYIRDISYSYENMDPTVSNAVPSPGAAVTVTVTGTGFYEGTLTGTYRIYDKTKDINRLVIDIDPQIYTGEEIRLKQGDIHVYASAADKRAKKELDGKDSCFEIVETTYRNNVKTGTARITLHGIGEYGGTKTCSFRIQKKIYAVNRVKGIRLDKTKHSFSLCANEDERKLTAIITPETTEQSLTNPTVVWASSNDKIATVEPIQTDTESNPQSAFTSSAIIHAQNTGNVTITATTQDGSRKAVCKITIDLSTFTQAGQTIKGKVGGTYQLTLDGKENQEILADGIAFESDNPNVVSVSDRGLLAMKKIGAATIKVYMGGKDNVQQCHVVVDGDLADPENHSRTLVYHQATGCSDDTPQINKLLREWEWNPDRYDYMYLPAGVYHIDAVSDFGGIVLTDNQTLIMSPDAQLTAIGNDRANSQMIYAFGRKNIVISGGKLVGERSSHTGTTGEWGHGINIAGCTNVHISDVEVSQCWGDGIYLGLYDGWDQNGNRTKYFSSGITITNCNLHHNRRNNLSITDAGDITIRNCHFNYAGSYNGQPGHDPQFGIDIEPNIAGYVCRNVKIYDSEFKGNTKASIGIITAADDVVLENCTLDGPFYNKAGTNVVLNGRPFPKN